MSVKMHPSVKLELCMAGVMGCMINCLLFSQRRLSEVAVTGGLS